MLTYKKQDNNTTDILHDGEKIGSIEVDGDKFVISVHHFNLNVSKKNPKRVKPSIEKLHEKAMEFKDYEKESEISAKRRGFTIKD